MAKVFCFLFVFEYHSQNFIGNEIPNEGFLLGLYAFAGTDHFKFGNNHRGELKPEGTGDLPDESYYLDAA